MIHNKKQIIWSVLQVFFILSIIGCQSLKAESVEEKAYILEKGITFGKGGDTELKLDLAHPARGKGPFPALVFIFGGAFGTGSRTNYSMEIIEAAKRGYVAVTVDYRLPGVRGTGKTKYLFPAQVHDVKCGVRWLRANAEKYRIDPNRIGAMGYSDGGWLTLMLGLTDSSHGLEGECGDLKFSSRVQAVVNIAGETELISWYHERGRVARGVGEALFGGAPEEVPEQYKAASPLTYVSKDDPPVLTIHGDWDHIVRPQQAELLDAKMKEVGASHTLILKKNRRHFEYRLWNFLEDYPVWDFFDRHLKADE